MLAEFERKTNIGVGLGLLVEFVGHTILKSGSPAAPAGVPLVVAGWAFFICGCGQYAKAKGFSGWWGLLGFLSIIGLLILFFFPDRHKEVVSA